MPTFVFLLGWIALILAVIAVIRGHLDWARIKSRKAAVVALSGAFVVMMAGASWGSATNPAQNSATPPPVTSTTIAAPTTTTATTTVVPTTTTTTTTPPPPPPVTTTTTVRPAAAAPAPVVRHTTVQAPPPGPALSCSASMSDANPADYSTTDVLVQTGVSGASVTATAHYKTTSTTHSVVAGGDGSADVPFRISDAIPGYPVDVEVSVSAGGSSQSCSTSFTPYKN